MSGLVTRILGWSLPLSALLGLGWTATRSAPAAEPRSAPTFGEVLAINNESLTSYKASGVSTLSNDLRPRVLNRGVSMSGAVRVSSAWGIAFGGNPMAGREPGAIALNGVDLRTGSFSPNERDISFATEGVPVAVGRTYNAQQHDGTSRRDSAGLQGNNWAQSGFPEVLLWEHATDAAEDLIYMNLGADRFVEFKRTGASSDEFQGRQGTAGYVAFTAAAGSDPETYEYTDRNGTTWTFFGHDANASNGAGQLWKVEDAAGNVTYVHDETNAATAASSSGFDSSGGPKTVYDASGRRFTYTYTSGRLTEVKAETKTGGTWASPTGLETVAEVDYGYYTTAGSHGSIGDLQTVTWSTKLSDTTHTSQQYYRYWRDADSEGDDHLVKMVLSAEGVRQYDLLDGTFDDDHLTATDTALEEYASHYFEYDSSGRISSATFNGDCGCSGGTVGVYNFSYEDNTGYTDTTGYTTTWATRTIVERPDATFLTQYFDEVGQPISSVVTDGDPAVGTPDTWATYVVRNSGGIVKDIHSPANVTGYTHTLASVAFTTSTTEGLVTNYTLDSSGGLRGFLVDKTFQEGTSGSKYLLESYTYDSEVLSGSNGETVRPMVASARKYPKAITSGTSGSTLTSYAYTYHTGTLVLETLTVTNPAVSTSKNGSGVSTTSSRHYDTLGRADFTKSEDGGISYTEYTNGRVTKTIRDADTTQTGTGQDFNGVTIPSGFASSGSPIHQVTSHTYDAQGRRETTTLPTGRVTASYVSQTDDRLMVQLSYPKFVSGSPSTYYGPVSYSVSNLEGKSVASGKIALTGNSSTAAQSLHVDESDDDVVTVIDGLGTLCRLTTSVYDESGGTASESRLYFDIPASGEGTEGTHYDATTFAYDGLGRRIRTVEPSGTIRRSTYDALGRVTQQAMGTDDTGLAGSTLSGTVNMVVTEAFEYDSGNDGGDGFLTKRTLYVVDGATDKRETAYAHDVRGNVLLQTNPTAPHSFHSYDNLSRRLWTSQHSSTANIVVGTDDPETEDSNRLALRESKYDEMGRVWKTKRFEVDASDGSDDDNLQALTWYDEEGRTIKMEGETLSKTRYDGLGRATHRFVLAVDDDSAYADADDVSGDIVLEESQTVYDSDSNLVLMRVRIDRHHDDMHTGETTGELDTNADADDLLLTASNLEGRAQITATWYDSLDRVEDTVRFGTYGGSNFDRDGMSVPARSDTALRFTNSYGTDGGVEEVTDPRDFVGRTERDDAGRTVKTIRNYDSSVNSGNPSGSDDNVTVKYEFTDGHRTKITADLPSGSTDQDTIYTFGTTRGATAGDSEVSTGHLMQKIQYPDSSGGPDVVTFAYNAQGQRVWKKDQEGNILEWDFDDSGREVHERVSTLDADFDGDVRRVSTTYDDLGRRSTVVQFDHATVGSGSATDGVAYTYDGWGNLIEYEEDRNSAVSSGNDEYDISYTWQKGLLGRNTLRKDQTTLPSGAVLDYDYRDTLGRHDSDVSRVSSIKHGSTLVATYRYNGVGQVVEMDYPQSDVRSTRFGSTSGEYEDWDRFNRITQDDWEAYGGTGTNFYEIELSYDRNSNITVIEDNVHSGFDVEYTMDDVDRLTQAEEGTWDGSSITSTSRDQQLTLDHVGNWEVDKLDLNGDGDFIDTGEVNDDRSHNTVNETTARDIDDDGTDDYTIAYDAAGNLTDDGENYKYEYDAFYRLRFVKDQSGNVVAEYRYNGLGHRIAEHMDTDDDGDVDGSDEWRYLANDERWRIVAQFLGSDTAPTEEFVHHAAGLSGLSGSSYIDLVVMRERDTDDNGSLEERMYYCQNWRADVSAIVDNAGEMYEWVKYSAYGVPFGLPGADADSDGDCDSGDVAQLQTWISSSAYDIRGDVDLDGDVDSGDVSAVQSRLVGGSLGHGAVSTIGNFVAWAGRPLAPFGLVVDVRRRHFALNRGAWISRDPIGMGDGVSLYQYGRSRPLIAMDPQGLRTILPGQGGPTLPGGGQSPGDFDDGSIGVGNLHCTNSSQESSDDNNGWGTCPGMGSIEFRINMLGCSDESGPPGTDVGVADCGANCEYRGRKCGMKMQWRAGGAGEGLNEFDPPLLYYWHGPQGAGGAGLDGDWPQWEGTGTKGKDGSSNLVVDMPDFDLQCSPFGPDCRIFIWRATSYQGQCTISGFIRFCCDGCQ